MRDIKFVRCITSILITEKIYAVCANKEFLVYDSTLKEPRSIGGWFMRDPVSAVFLPNNNFHIVDGWHEAVSVVTFHGSIIHHMYIIKGDKVNIQQTSYQGGYLWIVYTESVDGHWHLKRFNIFRS